MLLFCLKFVVSFRLHCLIYLHEISLGLFLRFPVKYLEVLCSNKHHVSPGLNVERTADLIDQLLSNCKQLCMKID